MLNFGQFKLKSGRLSPYFFTLGLISTGAALRESVAPLRAAGAQPVAAVIALDRQELGPHGKSAVAEMEREPFGRRAGAR